MEFLKTPWRSGLTSVWPLLLLWLAIAVPYTLRTSIDAYTHDAGGHIGYVRILHDQHRLPVPSEGWETHQPPLYYLLASALRPASPHHVQIVRLFSVLMGLAVLLLISDRLYSAGASHLAGYVSLLFLLTTPHFLFIFSTYNNDSLLALLAVSAWVLFLRNLESPSRQKLSGLWLIAALGFVTKLSFIAVSAAMVGAAVWLENRGTLRRKDFEGILVSQLLALPLLLCWMIFHNRPVAGEWIPTNWHIGEAMQHIPHSAWRTILTPPGFTTWEWVTPFTDHFLPVGKKNSLTAYMMVSSIFGEHPFRQMGDVWIWFILWVHGLWLVWSVMQIGRTRDLSLQGIAMFAGWLGLAAFIVRWPYGPSMDFRHVAWLYLPVTLLGAYALDHFPEWLSKRSRCIIVVLLLLCVLDQWMLISLL